MKSEEKREMTITLTNQEFNTIKNFAKLIIDTNFDSDITELMETIAIGEDYFENDFGDGPIRFRIVDDGRR